MGAWQHGLSPSEVSKMRGSYVWFDWFSIPQRGDTYNFALAVQSIPSFVDACDFFVALVPTIPHFDTGLDCNFVSWIATRPRLGNMLLLSTLGPCFLQDFGACKSP